MNKIINKNPSLRLIGKKTNRGFTIIETLVAITILMIAIAGPLVVANKSLTAALYAKDQITASYLAQEGVEVIRNLKDNGNNLGNNGNGWYMPILGGTCKSKNNPCDFDFNIGSVNFSSTYDSQFTRKYYYTEFSGNDEVAVTVIVTWKERTVANDVSITTNMTNTAF